MIKSKLTEAGDLHDLNVLHRYDEEDPRDELEELGYDTRKGAFQARRVG